MVPPGNPRASPTINVTVADGLAGNTTQLTADDAFTFAESGMLVTACASVGGVWWGAGAGAGAWWHDACNGPPIAPPPRAHRRPRHAAPSNGTYIKGTLIDTGRMNIKVTYQNYSTFGW